MRTISSISEGDSPAYQCNSHGCMNKSCHLIHQLAKVASLQKRIGASQAPVYGDEMG